VLWEIHRVPSLPRPPSMSTMFLRVKRRNAPLNPYSMSSGMTTLERFTSAILPKLTRRCTVSTILAWAPKRRKWPTEPGPLVWSRTCPTPKDNPLSDNLLELQ
jgi:hypothetical protein